MHRQIEHGYREAEAAIKAVYGSLAVRRAAGGETIALRNFNPILYLLDLSHPRPSLSVMAFCSVYSAIYKARACDISPDFGTPSNLGARLNAFGIGQVQWDALAGTADRVAGPGHPAPARLERGTSCC